MLSSGSLGLILQLIPEGSCKNDVLKGAITTEVTEHGEVSHDGIGHSLIFDAVEVNDSTELDVVHVRRAEGLSDIGKNICIASVRVIEAGRVKKDKLLALDEALVGFRLLRACWRLMFARHP